MKAKIEWYQEVLELEPGSKVFFPLAQLLGEGGEADEAIRVLRQGLARHPEYIEARLLLVQLLQKSGDSARCIQELSEITGIFAQYPGFWEAWSEHSPGDVACALRFLSVALRSPGLSLREVFEAGLREMNNAEPARRAAAQGDKPAARMPVGQPAAAVVSEPVAMPAAPDAPEPSVMPVPLEEEHDEPSVRTRTMAEVLAAQGDIQGAVDIYSEILADAAGDDADKLRERLADLTARLGSASEPASAPAGRAQPGEAKSAKTARSQVDAGVEAAASAQEAPDLPADATVAENPMRDMLEKLAERLDARAEA